jgi:DNA/RNA-binding domain of Phe-tRNA-synthetase-like protein
VSEPAAWLAAARVEADVFALRPDYRALLVAADGLQPGPSDAASEAVLRAAEVRAAGRLAGVAPHELPHVAQWREAFRGFGAKPQRERTSVEALLRRVAGGLPRIDRITDVYNAVSIAHVLPVGGEDRRAYVGAPRLARAGGDEPFDTTADGAAVIDHPAPGEVIWRDDAGVTCRRWNWRQCLRTRISLRTTSAVFVLDALGALSADELQRAADELVAGLAAFSPRLSCTARLLTGDQ